jgi:hypothetical protein
MIAEKIKELGSGDKESRIRHAEELGDLLEYGKIPLSELEGVAASLINAIAGESEAQAREALTNTLAILASRKGGFKAPWDRLAAMLPQFDTSSLENALVALGFSGDGKFEKVLKEYEQHAEETIRDAAADALIELGTRDKPGV